MTDWLPGIIIAAIAAIPALWATIQQRRKTAAEVDSALVQSYKLLVDDLRTELEESRQGCRLREEEVKGLKEEIALLYEQKMSLVGHNQVLTARLAFKGDEDLTNNAEVE